jgi:predicted lactoylglutathione lyase
LKITTATQEEVWTLERTPSQQNVKVDIEEAKRISEEYENITAVIQLEDDKWFLFSKKDHGEWTANDELIVSLTAVCKKSQIEGIIESWRDGSPEIKDPVYLNKEVIIPMKLPRNREVESKVLSF